MKKDYVISSIRMTTTFMIIFCHIFSQIGFSLENNEIIGRIGDLLSVGVQIFLILSGYLYGKKKNYFENICKFDFIKKNFAKILLDYYVYLFLVIFPVYYILKPQSITYSSVWKILCTAYTLGGVHHLWFIPYILICYFFTPLLYDLKVYIKSKTKNLWSMVKYVLLIMIIECVYSIAFKSYFNSAWINSYIFGFFLPDIINYIKKNRQKSYIIISIIIGIVLNIIKKYIRYDFQPTLENGSRNWLFCQYYINYSRVFFAISLFVSFKYIGNVILKYILNSNKTRLKSHAIKILDLSDKYSFDIYICHMIYIKGPLSLLSITNIYIVNILITLLVTIISAIILRDISDLVKYLFDYFRNELRNA